MASAVAIKVVYILLVFCCGLLSLFPIRVALKTVSKEKLKKLQVFFSYASSFGGGAFLATGLMHLLPEGDEQFNDYTDSEFPWAYFVAVVGFLIIYWVEQVADEYIHHKEAGCPSHTHSSGHDEEQKEVSVVPVVDDKNVEETQDLEDLAVVGASAAHDEDDCPATMNGGCHVGSALANATTAAEAYSLVLAISLHSLFEGVALGASEDLSAAFVVFVSIIAHKASAGFALGVALAASPLNKKVQHISAVLFSLAAPVGALAGVILTESTESDGVTLVTAIANCLAAGTFIYLSLEILGAHEAHKERTSTWKSLLATFFGVALLATATGIAGHEGHGHDEDEEDHDDHDDHDDDH